MIFYYCHSFKMSIRFTKHQHKCRVLVQWARFKGSMAWNVYCCQSIKNELWFTAHFITTFISNLTFIVFLFNQMKLIIGQWTFYWNYVPATVFTVNCGMHSMATAKCQTARLSFLLLQPIEYNLPISAFVLYMNIEHNVNTFDHFHFKRPFFYFQLYIN